MESHWIRRDGTTLFVRESARIIRDGPGDGLYYEGTVEDITERKRGEDRLSASLAWQEAIFEGSRDAVLITDADSKFVMVNRRACELTGYSKQELLGMRIPDLHEQQDLAAYNLYHDRIMSGEELVSEATLLRKDGAKVDTEFSNRCVSISGEAYMHTIACDITERKRAEEALRESENRLALAIECTGLGLWDQDFRTGQITRNDNWSTMLGYEPDDIASDIESYRELLHPDDVPHFEKSVKTHEAGLAPTFDVEHRMRTKSGEYRWIHNFGRVVERDDQGRSLRALGMHVDITERKNAEEALRDSEKRYAQAAQRARFGYWERDFANGTAVWSVETCDIFGVDAEEFEPTFENLLSLVHPSDRESLKRAGQKTLSSGEKRDIEYRIIRPDGEERHIHSFSEAVRDEKGKPTRLAGTVQDITERKRAEERVSRATAILDGINRVLREALTCETEEELGRACLAVAEELTGSKFGFVREVNETRRLDTIAISSLGWDACKIPETEALKLLKDVEVKGIRGQIIQQERSLMFNEPASDRMWIEPPPGHPKITSFLGVPLKHEGKTIGMIGLGNKKSGYEPADQDAVEKLAVAFVEALMRKRAEHALRQSEQKLKTVIDHSAEVFYIHDTNNELIYVSPKCEEVFGYTPEEMMVNWTTLITDSPVNKRGIEFTERAIKTGRKLGPYLLEITRKDGKPRIVEIDESPVKDEDGKVVAITGALRDITARMKAEEAVKGRAHLNRILLDAMPSVAMLIRPHIREVVACNEKAAEMGVTPGKRCFEAWGDGEPCPGCLAPQLWETGQPQQREVKESGLVWDAHWIPVSENLYMYYAYDITERKQVLQEIRNVAKFPSENPYPVLRVAHDGIVLYANVASVALLKDENSGIDQPAPQRWRQVVENVLASGAVERMEITCKGRVLAFRAVPVSDSGYVNFYGVDITERNKAEKELRENQAKLKGMASRILHAEDNERRRIAIGLHDNICQQLVLTKFALESSVDLISNSDASSLVNTACGAIGEAIEKADSLTFALSNPVLRELGFVAALQKYLDEEIQQKHGLAYDFEGDEQSGVLPDDIKNCLFRVSRELLTNIVKHARARTIRVSVRRSRGRVRLSIQDDGVGFQDAKAGSKISATSGFGLFSVREQLEHLGGRFEIESGSGRGTTATAVVPLRKKPSV